MPRWKPSMPRNATGMECLIEQAHFRGKRLREQQFL
jgi:hypothetical protein